MFRASRITGLIKRQVVGYVPGHSCRQQISASLAVLGATFKRGIVTGEPKMSKNYEALVARKLFLETPFKISANAKLENCAVVEGGKYVEVTWDDGVTSRYHSLWLRHGCHCPACRLSANQTVVKFQHVDLNTTIVRAEKDGEKLLNITWSDDDKHTGLLPLPFLRYYDSSDEVRLNRAAQKKIVFIKQDRVPEVTYDDVMESDTGLNGWLQALNIYGICLMKNAPLKSEQLRRIAARLGLQLMYHDGSADIYNVVADVKDPDTFAYSAGSLPVHMDLQIYESPPGIQLLHCLRFDKSIVGGENVFVDLLHVADTIRYEHPSEFEDLCRIPGTWTTIFYRGDHPRHMTFQRPHILLNSEGEIIGVKWHPPSTIGMQARECDIEKYYKAYKLMETMIENFPFKQVLRLQEGDIITMNNRRWGHGRKQFDISVGKRHLQGGYFQIDEFQSKIQYFANTVGDGKLVHRMGNNSWE